jgi:hypothetical protein
MIICARPGCCNFLSPIPKLRKRRFCSCHCGASCRSKPTPETSLKISQRLKGRRLTAEHKLKIGMGNKGVPKPHSEERKREISRQWTGSGNPKWEPDREKLRWRRFMKGKWRGLLRRSLQDRKQKKTGTTAQMLGYTPDELRVCIERLWKPGMTWKNYGRHGWHIDHIRPFSRWPADATPAEVNALSNLQPMWWLDNLRKGSTWNESVECCVSSVEKS